MHDFVSLYACLQSMMTGGGKQILFETKLSQQIVYIPCSVWYRFVFFLLQLKKHALKGILSIRLHVFAFTRYAHYLSLATLA